MSLLHHARTADEVLRTLGTDPERGLSDDDVIRRRAESGRNVLPDERKDPLWLKFLRQFHGMLRYILFAAAAVSFWTGEITDGIGILIAVLIDAVFGFVQERRAESAIDRLRSMIVQEATVIRGGKVRRIAAEDLVPGDILRIAEGDRIAADARLLEEADLSMTEASLTGESMPVRKATAPVAENAPVADRYDMVWMGTSVTVGTAKAVVTEIGIRTEFGRIAASLGAIRRDKTPFEKRVDRLGRTLGVSAIVLAGIVLAGGILRGFPVESMFIFSVAMLVSVIPEGLPAVLAVVLAIGVQRMARRNAIIRHVPSVETLGVCDVICTDKTGTLTENKMTVREIATSEHVIAVTGEGWETEGKFLHEGHDVRPSEVPSLDLLLKGAALCNDTFLERKDDRPGIIGDPTEGALVVAAAKAGLEKSQLEKEYRRIDSIPFSSDRKYRAVLVDHVDLSGHRSRHLFAVGAYDVLAPHITSVMWDGRSVAMTEVHHRHFDESNRRMADRVMRVLCVAHRAIPITQDTVGDRDIVGLALLGLVAMIDPPREGVGRAIAQCRRAGIRVIMVTGDQAPTAVAIARSIGLIDGHGEPSGIFTEQDIAALDDAAFSDLVRDAAVFARVSPATKLRIVTTLQEHGHTVAMTGDGVNDAPALKKASIGISMGIAGTDVSREVADMVLADDHFVSIVSAIEEGRTVFQNVKNTTAFLFMTNVGEAVTVLASMIIGLPLPILPAQVLWMNLVTDGFTDIALATEPTDKDALDKPPRAKEEPILTREIYTMSVLTVMVMCVGTLGMFAWELRTGGIDHARTMAFTMMAVFQLWNVFNLRSLRASIFTIGFFSNPWVSLAVAVSFVMQLAVIYLPGLHDVFRTTMLSWIDWVLIIGVTSTMIWAVEVYKFVGRRREGRLAGRYPHPR